MARSESEALPEVTVASIAVEERTHQLVQVNHMHNIAAPEDPVIRIGLSNDEVEDYAIFVNLINSLWR